MRTIQRRHGTCQKPPERFLAFGEGDMDERNVSLGGGSDEFLVKEFVGEACSGGIMTVGRKENFPDLGPVESGHTHGAGFATRVENAVLESVAAEVFGCVAEGDDFRVSGGVVGGQHPIPASCDDRAVLNNDGAERTALSLLHSLNSKGEGFLEKTEGIFSFGITHVRRRTIFLYPTVNSAKGPR